MSESFGDIEAESAVLGTVLHGRTEFAALELRAEDFSSFRHRLVFEAMARLASAGRPPADLLEIRRVLGDRLKPFGTSEGLERAEAGLYAFLSELDANATFGNLPVYVKRVRTATLTRRVFGTLGELSKRMESGQLAGAEALEAAYASLAAIGEHRHDDPTAELGQLAGDLVRKKMAEVEALKHGGTVAKIATGISELDGIIGGVAFRKLTILAGGTSHGKSSLARTIALNAHAAGLGVHVFSLEDDSESYAERTLSDLAEVKLWTLANAPERLTAEEMARLVGRADDLRRRRGFLVDDTPSLSAAKIAIRVRKHKPANATRLVVVDYLQQLREPGIRPGPGSKKLHVDAAVDALVELARLEDVAILALCQLNRDGAREGRAPELHDLRESGEIEQQAHAVMAVYRPERDAKNAEERARLEGQGVLRVLKNKKGGVGDCSLRFNAERATYHSAGASA